MAHAKLVHRVKRTPGLTLHVEQVYLPISVGVFATNENDFGWGDSQSRASPKRVLHAHCEDHPSVFVHIVHLDRVVDLLLSRTEESTKCVDEFVVDGAGAEVVAFVLHNGHLGPLVLFHFVLFHRAQSLFTAEASKYVDIASAHCNGVCISALIHGALVGDLILESEV